MPSHAAPGVSGGWALHRSVTLLHVFLLASAGILFIGATAVDYSGYPDCRPEFLAAFERLADLATRAGTSGQGRFRVHAPLLRMSKRDIIERGLELGVDYGLTVSCYAAAPDGAACGRCDACRLRLRGFTQLGIPDPGVYRTGAPL